MCFGLLIWNLIYYKENLSTSKTNCEALISVPSAKKDKCDSGIDWYCMLFLSCWICQQILVLGFSRQLQKKQKLPVATLPISRYQRCAEVLAACLTDQWQHYTFSPRRKTNKNLKLSLSALKVCMGNLSKLFPGLILNFWRERIVTLQVVSLQNLKDASVILFWGHSLMWFLNLKQCSFHW